MRHTHERRRHARVQARFLAEWDANGAFVPSEVVEISPFGVFIETLRTAVPGQLIQLSLYVPDGRPAIECYGWVKHCGGADRHGIGVELFAMWERDRERWNEYYVRCFKAERRIEQKLTA